MDLRVKRAYEPATDDDGWRVLVDRMWPRGLSRARIKIDDWQRDLAPSRELRRWFAHKPERFPEFRRRYLAELEQQPHRVAQLRQRARTQTVTLVYAAQDSRHNQAVVLAELLRAPDSGPAADDTMGMTDHRKRA
jgi:uncharacterized protein YeaO (DUF488 family)